jgi:HK97 family phage portal protein
VSLFGLYDRRDNVQNPAVPLTSASLLSLLGGQTVEAGVAVTPETSLQMSAVFRATTLVSALSASMPMVPYKVGTKNPTTSAILTNPHPDLTPFELWQLSYAHRCLWGNSYMQKVRTNGGQLTWLFPIHPSSVRVGKVKPSEANPSGKVFEVTTDHGVEPYTSNEILHIPGFGYDGITGVSRVRLAAQNIGTSLAAERYAGKLFGSGNLMTGVLQTDQRLEQTQAEAIQARWRTKTSGLDSAHETVVLDSGAKFSPMSIPSKDAEMLDTRRYGVMEIGRYFGVPPFLMMETEKSTSWGTGLEQQATGFVTFDLHPQWLAPTEQRVTRDVAAAGTEVRYNMDSLLRGDSAARAAFYSVMRNTGAYNADDIREREDMPPIPDGKGQSFLQPVNMQPLGAPSPVTDGSNGGT